MTLTEEDSILINYLYLLKGFAAKRLIKEHFSPLCIHLRVNLVCIKSFFTNMTTNNRMLFITEHIRGRHRLIYCL